MNSHDKTYQSHSSPVNPWSQIRNQTSPTPPSYPRADYSQYPPQAALRPGTYWNPASFPLVNPYEPAWHPYRPQRMSPYTHSVYPSLSRHKNEPVSHFQLQEQGMSPEDAYQLVHDEIAKDGNARLNLATFVTTWMENTANRLHAEAYNKNLIDKDEYPQTAAIEERCVRILAELWHSPSPQSTMGVSTAGSSEGCMLGGLALKRNWQNARRKQGKPIDRPNIVFSSAVQVVWKKFANYWDVEPRFVNITPESPFMDPDGVLAVVDENTIGVVPTLGVTYTGLYEPVAVIAKALDQLQTRTGLDIPIHVDAASGGFIAPFLQPDLIWDFQLPRVKSINVSGHKFGLVYPGIGWIIWREARDLPEDLIFRVSYLGGNMPTFGLNFSRPSAQVLLQYYNFLRLGKDGYYQVQKHSQEVAHFLSKAIQEMGPFQLFTDGSDIPVLSWRLKNGYTTKWNLYDLSRQLRTYGWQVPAYPLPPTMENITIMRVVVRNGFSMEMAQFFLMNLLQAAAFLDSLDGPIHSTKGADSFHH